MTIYDIPANTLSGEASSLAPFEGKTVLVVNVASKCGLTPQYEGLEKLQKQYEGRGFSVVGFPSNQFAGQEPGTAEEIVEFCSATYGVTFPLMEKTNVNGRYTHPLYKELKHTKDHLHIGGPVQWNFEKFLVSPDDTVVRFRPRTTPDDPAVVSAVEHALTQVASAA